VKHLAWLRPVAATFRQKDSEALMATAIARRITMATRASDNALSPTGLLGIVFSLQAYFSTVELLAGRLLDTNVAINSTTPHFNAGRNTKGIPQYSVREVKLATLNLF